jgi:hypothetical protein
VNPTESKGITVNQDHRDNIGTHPAYSEDPETRLRARAEAAQRRKAQADQDYTTARNNLRVFLEAKERVSFRAGATVEDQQESKC